MTRTYIPDAPSPLDAATRAPHPAPHEPAARPTRRAQAPAAPAPASPAPVEVAAARLDPEGDDPLSTVAVPSGQRTISAKVPDAVRDQLLDLREHYPGPDGTHATLSSVLRGVLVSGMALLDVGCHARVHALARRLRLPTRQLVAEALSRGLDSLERESASPHGDPTATPSPQRARSRA